MREEKPQSVPEAIRLGLSPVQFFKFESPYPTSFHVFFMMQFYLIAVLLLSLSAPWEWDGGFVYEQRKILSFIFAVVGTHDVVILLRRFLARKADRAGSS